MTQENEQTVADFFHDAVMDLLRNAKSVNSNTVAKIWIEAKNIENANKQIKKREIMDAYIQGVIDGSGEILNRETIKEDALRYYEQFINNK